MNCTHKSQNVRTNFHDKPKTLQNETLRQSEARNLVTGMRNAVQLSILKAAMNGFTYGQRPVSYKAKHRNVVRMSKLVSAGKAQVNRKSRQEQNSGGATL